MAELARGSAQTDPRRIIKSVHAQPLPKLHKILTHGIRKYFAAVFAAGYRDFC